MNGGTQSKWVEKTTCRRIEGREQIRTATIDRLLDDGVAETAEHAAKPVPRGALAAGGGVDVDQRPGEGDRG